MSDFKPITTQEELDAVIASRLRRERSTIVKRVRKGIVSIIKVLLALSDDLNEIENMH